MKPLHDKWQAIDRNQISALFRILRTAELEGVLVLAPICPKCGFAHDYQILHSLEDDDVPDLLREVIADWDTSHTIQ